MATIAATPLTSAGQPTAEAAGENELQAIQQFIENALDLLLKGNATNYHYLIQQLSATSAKPEENSARRKIFLALPRCISSMAKEPSAYHQLLDVLFKYDFLSDRAEIDAYTSFLVHLVSSNTVYVLPALQTLVRNLCRPSTLPPALAAAVAATQAPPAPASSARRISIGGSFGAPAAPVQTAPAVPPIDIEKRIQDRFDDVHATLQRVLTLVPTAANALFPVLVEHFPHKRHESAFQVAYLRNILRVTTYVPGLQERVFGLIIDRLVAVDVEIKLDEKEEDVFTMDDFLDDDLLPGNGTQVDEMADKLDQMMLIVFEHIERQVYTETTPEGRRLDGPQATLMFKFLLKVFDHSILNTHRSKYPQFLLFYVCQMDPQFQDVFISQLLAASLDPQTPSVTRHSCGAYLASFLARAKYISVSYIQKALYHLLKWMHDQMDTYDALYQPATETSIEAEAAQLEGALTMTKSTAQGAFHETIYISTLQTVCYLVCYRGLEVAQCESGGYEFLRSLGWERLLITPTSYCPLAFCQQTVATEFLNFIETFDLVSDECIDRVDQAITSIGNLQKRKPSKTMERTAAPPTSKASGGGGVASASGSSVLGLRQPLETFFPFDPYLLRRSFKYIGPSYLYWKHVDPMSSENAEALLAVKEIIRAYQEAEDEDGDDDDEDDDDSEEEEDEDSAEAMSLVGSVTMASFKEDSYLSTSQNYSMSVGSEDGEQPFPDSGIPGVLRITSRRKQRVQKLVSRTTFAPSPALSASSPPSQLPRMESMQSFTLAGFEEDDEEGF